MNTILPTLPAEVENFRKAYALLSPYDRNNEVMRLYRIINSEPVYYVEFEGKTYKTYSVAGIMRIMTTKCRVPNPDRSNIHKVLKGKRKTLNGGITIYAQPQE